MKPKKQYRTLSYYWNIKFTKSTDFIDETGGMTRPSVSTSSSSIHSNSWSWKVHSGSFCHRAATRCGRRRGGWTVSADCLPGGSEGISDGVVFCFLCICLCKDTSLIEQSPLHYVLRSRTAVVVAYALWKILWSGNTKLSFQR